MPGAVPDGMESEAMEKISVWGFRWAPDFAQGLVRDLRVRWALIEAGRDYEIELIGFEERASGTYRQRQPFGMVPAFEADGQRLFESGAIVHRNAQDSAALMPADAQARAEVLPWMFAALNTRSEEHTSELKSQMRISLAVLRLKKK